MGFFSSLRQFFALRQTNDEKPYFTRWFSRKNLSGVPVDHDSALTLSAVWACVGAISRPIAYLSCHVRRALPDGGSEILNTNPVDWLVSRQANPETTAYTFREVMTAWALTWGNGYAEIERDGAGRARWLWQIPPDRVNPDRTSRGELVYDITNRGNSNTVLNASDMFHLKGLGFDGTAGYSVISYARQSIGLGLATEKFGAEFFGNGLHPGGVAEHPGKLSPQARKNLEESLREQVKNAHDLLILEEGMKWTKTSIPPEDAQFLQTREFQIPEICRWFNVKPHKIADLSRATFSNIEHENISSVTDTLLPWVERWEQEADVKLFGSNRGNFYTKFNVASLLRGDTATRNQAYATGRQWGWLSVNDIRQLEEMNPLPPHIGDTYLVPANMTALHLDPNQPPQTFLPPTPREGNLPQTEEDRALDYIRAFAQLVHRDTQPPVYNVHLNVPASQITVPERETRIENHSHVSIPERDVKVQVDGARLVLNQQPINVQNNLPDIRVNVEAPQVSVPEREVRIENIHQSQPTTVYVDAPQTHVTVNTPEQVTNIENKVDVQPQPVTVENKIDVPPPHIQVEVPPATPTAAPQPKRTVEKIIRDNAGEIVKIVREVEE